jgi:prepilin-type N-terminal cleavage/methylation domain-containing protein
MCRSKNAPSTHGFTLVELLVAMAAMAVVIALVVQAMIGLDREQAVRTKVSQLQGNARQALDLMESDLRHASLAAGTGVIWTDSGGRVSRPAIQVFTAVQGGSAAALADAKPNTDAVLVVEAMPGWGYTANPVTQPVTLAALSTSTAAIDVSDARGFAVGQTVLLGDYADATWGSVSAVTATDTTNQITLAGSVNVLPGKTITQLAAGAFVRGARARLFYVDTSDELVRLTLSVPRPPSTTEIVTRDVLGIGFENMQIDCQLDNGSGGFVACSDASNPAPVLASTNPITTEASATFGSFAGGGPRFSAANVGLLRTIVVAVAVRNTALQGSGTGALRDGYGDPPIALTGASGTAVTLGPGSATGALSTDNFIRRGYRLAASMRNTSLWNF